MSHHNPVVPVPADVDFDEPELVEVIAEMTPEQRLKWDCRVAMVGHIMRPDEPLSKIARRLGVERATLSKIRRDIVRRLGIGNTLSTVERRMRNREAAKRNWERRRKKTPDAVQTSGGHEETNSLSSTSTASSLTGGTGV